MNLTRWQRAGRGIVALAAAALVLAGCGPDTDAPSPSSATSSPGTVAREARGLLRDATLPPAVRALALVPLEAETVTVTDYDAIRDRFGMTDLSSGSAAEDRSRFWERAERDAVLLSPGLLRGRTTSAVAGRGFSQDDVAWEARFAGPEGEGFVVAFRSGVDMGPVSAAVAKRDVALRGARVLVRDRLLVKGTADPDEEVWGEDGPAELIEPGAESLWLRRSCVELPALLGPGASYDESRVADELDLHLLDPLDAVSVTFEQWVATARLGPDRRDLFPRSDLAAQWPKGAQGSQGPGVAYRDAFVGEPAVDPSTGRIGLQIADVGAAARLVTQDRLPFTVCPTPPPTS
ncbi:hypothetical protein [Nocardioides pacificus]